MMTPSVSVVMPVHNAESTLEAAVSSLQAQDLGDLEILMVDHGSTDGSAALMHLLARSDKRVRVLKCQGSFVEASNLAWRSATGNLIARMDADDIADPSRLRKQRAFLLDHPNLAGCATQVRILRQGPLGDLREADNGYRRYETWINSVLSPETLAAERFVDSPLPNPTVMLRREVLEEAGGYADPPWAEDYDLWLRLFEAGHQFGKVPEVLLDWIDGSTRATRTRERYSLSRFQQAKAHYLSRLPAVRESGVVVCGAGPTGKDMAKRLRQHGIALHAFLEVNPRQIGQRIAGVPVQDSTKADTFHGRAIMLAAVGSAEGRKKVRTLLKTTGWTEGLDFFCVA